MNNIFKKVNIMCDDQDERFPSTITYLRRNAGHKFKVLDVDTGETKEFTVEDDESIFVLDQPEGTIVQVTLSEEDEDWTTILFKGMSA